MRKSNLYNSLGGEVGCWPPLPTIAPAPSSKQKGVMHQMKYQIIIAVVVVVFLAAAITCIVLVYRRKSAKVVPEVAEVGVRWMTL